VTPNLQLQVLLTSKRIRQINITRMLQIKPRSDLAFSSKPTFTARSPDLSGCQWCYFVALVIQYPIAVVCYTN
jgi:hypothetical protein